MDSTVADAIDLNSTEDPSHNVISIELGKDGYHATCSNEIIAPDPETHLLTFSIDTQGWRFVTKAIPPNGHSTFSSPHTPQGQPACGIWIDVPSGSFDCASFIDTQVQLRRSPHSTVPKGDHYYVALMTDGMRVVPLDPIIRDPGPSGG